MVVELAPSGGAQVAVHVADRARSLHRRDLGWDTGAAALDLPRGRRDTGAEGAGAAASFSESAESAAAGGARAINGKDAKPEPAVEVQSESF